MVRKSFFKHTSYVQGCKIRDDGTRLGKKVQEKAMAAARGTVMRVKLFMPFASRITPIIKGNIAIKILTTISLLDETNCSPPPRLAKEELKGVD